MPSKYKQRLKNIFTAATEIEISKRGEFLQKACGEDVELRVEIEKLLASFDKAESFLENPAVEEVADLIVEEDKKFKKDQHFGSYKIISQIGAGGMGEVYLAKDTRLNRQTALKILPADLINDKARLSRFRREAQTASSLNHPNVITIYEIGEFEDTNYIATEFVEGETLREKISRGNLEPSEILDISVQIVSGLAIAHKANIVHRDVKPENIMIRPDGIVKILDFGLAKLIGKSEEYLSGELTTPGMVIGTINYMSPEQAKGAEIDDRTDLWSFGVCLYEMLTGNLPFVGKTVNHKLVAIMENAPAPFESNKIPAFVETEKIIYKLLEKSLSKRYQTAEDLLKDLQIVRKNLRIAPAAAGFISEKKNTNTINRTMTDKSSERTLISEGGFANNLLKNRTPFIGREREIAQINNLLGEARLVTLKGIGGTGKTRIAQEIARRMIDRFPDGVFFIPLADIKNHELVISEIARTLGLNETGGNSIGEILTEFLESKKLLLVIDNFEQVVNAAADLSALIDAAPDLKILVTSRALLKIEPEQEFAVPPLNLPENIKIENAENLLEYESIKLFVERAAALKPNFSITEENAAAIAEICASLEGLPLAIELAAARIKILAPRQIAERLENRLKILTSGARDLPSRQQTMRGAIEWSFELLDAAEKLLFRRLAVFVGGFTFEAVENVCENGIDILDPFTVLLENSLLIRTDFESDEPRFRMLEIVREFAIEKLEKSGEFSEIKEKHVRYFYQIANQADPHLLDKEGTKWLDLLNKENENIRIALEWANENDAEMLVKIVAAIRDFWLIRNHLSEGRSWTETAFKKADHATDEELCKISGGLGQIAKFQGDFETAEKAFQKVLEMSIKINDPKQTAIAYNGLAMTAKNTGNYDSARKYAEKSLTISRELNNKFAVAVSVNTLGELARMENDFAAARAFYEEGLQLCRELNNIQGINCTLNNIGAVAYSAKDYQTARDYYAEAFQVGSRSGEKYTTSYSLDGFAALALKADEFEKSAMLAGAADNLRDSLGYKIEPAESRFRDVYLAELQTVLDEKDFARFYEQGKTSDIEEVAASVLNSELEAINSRID